MFFYLTILVTLFLSYSNGSNDNFKGVATLYGSQTLSYKQALWLGSIATLLGSLTAFVIANELIVIFKGEGLVPAAVLSMQSFPVVTGLAAGVVVLTATYLGLPVSTTHALIGGLAGAGVAISPTGINTELLLSKFFLPLIVGPLLSFLLAYLLYPWLKKMRQRLGISRETCLCIGKKVISTVPLQTTNKDALNLAHSMSLPYPIIDKEVHCRSQYMGSLIGINAQKVLDIVHFLSAALVSFARGLNDTPKIAALLLITGQMDQSLAIFLVGPVRLWGGVLHSRKIAEMMGRKVTDMNCGQATTANLVTGFMVLFASKWGMPVSTTHVSCGSIFGIGSATGKARWKVIRHILFAWFVTLPAAFLLGFLLMRLF